ncbi:MAG TPA: VCBS repeat-containing protein [Myxococcota bacterium]|nr:VCBS repeat-containing protein [Myxococcota bacterium]
MSLGDERLVEVRGDLVGLGPGTPRPTKIVRDLGAGRWVVLEADGWLRATTLDGEPRGQIRSPGTAVLGNDHSQGGDTREVTVRGPTTAWADLDGDGFIDVLRPGGTSLGVFFTTPEGIGTREATWELPYELFSRDEDDDAENFRWITDVHFSDIDGDGRDDLLVHFIVSDSGFFGSTGEIQWFLNTGAGFEEQQTLTMGSASGESYLRDVDGDGDRDLLVAQVDISFANAAQALVSKSITVQFVAFAFDETFATEPRVLREVRVSLENFDVAWSMDEDISGDGIEDPVIYEDGEVIVFASEEGVFVETHRWRVAHDVSELTVADLTGDGRPEIIAWAPGEERATILVLD